MGRVGAASRAGVADDDALRLRELGYEQELRRGLHWFDNVAIGFATISPVVGLYAVVFVGMMVAGPAWVLVLPVALAGQCLLLMVYAELASEFPLANGVYQWSRRLLGPAYGWFSGWIAVCAYAVANTTIAYLGAPWVLSLLSIDASAHRIVAAGAALVVIASLLNALGVTALARVLRAGVAAEALAGIGVALALLLAFRERGLGSLPDTLGAEAASGGSTAAALLAALAVAGWIFIGFDACVAAAEETRGAARNVPRAIWVAVLGVALIVFLDAVAVSLAHPEPGDVVRGNDVDPVTRAVVTSFGTWSTKPFVAVVVTAFLACGTAAQGLTARAIYSAARDDVFPASKVLRTVDRRRVPVAAVVAVTAVASLGLLLGLEATAIGTLIAFGTAALYLSLLLVALAALGARVSGRWRPAGEIRLGRAGTPVNTLAVGWLAFETINVAWPRALFAGAGSPWYQVWAAPLVLAIISVAGGAYLLVARPHTKLADGRP